MTPNRDRCDSFSMAVLNICPYRKSERIHILAIVSLCYFGLQRAIWRKPELILYDTDHLAIV